MEFETIGELIDRERRTDDCDESNDLIGIYNKATMKEKEILDNAFSALTGWRLMTLIEKYENKCPNCGEPSDMLLSDNIVKKQQCLNCGQTLN